MSHRRTTRPTPALKALAEELDPIELPQTICDRLEAIIKNPLTTAEAKRRAKRAATALRSLLDDLAALPAPKPINIAIAIAKSPTKNQRQS